MCKSVANLQTLHCIMETKTTTANKVKNSNRVDWGFVRSFKVKTNILFTVLLLFSGIVFSSCEKVENDSMEIKVLDESRLAKSEEISVRSARAQWCWCTDYIKNRLGYPGAKTGDAKDMGPWLSTVGWYEVSDISVDNLPRNKDIILFSPGAHGIKHPAGHVGIIATSKRNGNSIYVTVVGANQDGKNRRNKTEYNCNNVCVMEISNLNLNYVSIWRKW